MYLSTSFDICVKKKKTLVKVQIQIFYTRKSQKVQFSRHKTLTHCDKIIWMWIYLFQSKKKTIEYSYQRNLVKYSQSMCALLSPVNRIVVYGQSMLNAVVKDSAKPFNFQRAFRLNWKQVSGHKGHQDYRGHLRSRSELIPSDPVDRR